MNYKGLISSIAIAAIVSGGLISSPGCANVVPPQGGPRDSLPPVLINAEPGDSTRNFQGRKVTFVFDEFVDVQNVQENLIVSPLPKQNPQIDFRLNTVTIKLKDSLESNTTYTFDFGDAIKDFNEGNVLKKFTYTFSTGSYIDSLELNGKVVMAETGKVDSTLIVMLYTNEKDSAVITEKPLYITKLDTKGGFTFKNLPQKKFYVYALKDEGGSHKYYSDKMTFAFADKPVITGDKTEPITLYAYAPKQTAPPAVIAPTSNIGRNRIAGAVDKRLKYQTNLIANQQDLLTNFYMNFDQPLRSFDSTKILLYTDSTYAAVPAYSFKKDSTNRKIVLTYSWKENTVYHIIMQKDFAEDSSGLKLLKTDTLTFITKKLAEYGGLKIKFRNLDLAKNPVLLFVLNETVVKSIPLKSNEFAETIFLPGDYELRILYDDNKNGTWDPGQFAGKHKQPEIVRQVERKITVKPAWQNEFEIAL